jgi:hypothetical protein
MRLLSQIMILGTNAATFFFVGVPFASWLLFPSEPSPSDPNGLGLGDMLTIMLWQLLAVLPLLISWPLTHWIWPLSED